MNASVHWTIGLLSVLLLTTGPGLTTAYAYGGRDAMAPITSSYTGGTTGPDTWDIDPDLTDATGEEISGDTINLEHPITTGLRDVFENLGGQEGTGMTFEQWSKTARAGKAVVQMIREEDQANAKGEAGSANTSVVVLEWVDWTGQKVQTVLSFCPPVSATVSTALDAGRGFADAYNKALEQGHSTAEAIDIGLKKGIVKGVTTAITSKTLGNAAGNTWSKAKNINPNSVKSVAKAGSNLIGTAGLKTGENLANAGFDAALPDPGPTNQAPQPTYMPEPDIVTPGGHSVYK